MFSTRDTDKPGIIMCACTFVPVCTNLKHMLCFVFLNILHNGRQTFKVSIIYFLKFQMGVYLDMLLFNMFSNDS